MGRSVAAELDADMPESPLLVPAHTVFQFLWAGLPLWNLRHAYG
jgi:hypothetical protein